MALARRRFDTSILLRSIVPLSLDKRRRRRRRHQERQAEATMAHGGGRADPLQLHLVIDHLWRWVTAGMYAHP